MDGDNCSNMPWDIVGDGDPNPNEFEEIEPIVSWVLNGDSDTNQKSLAEIDAIVNSAAAQFWTPQSSPPTSGDVGGRPWVEMYKQPQRLVRFRYASEQKRQPQVVHAEMEDSKNDGWPSIRILNCTGHVTIHVYCATHLGPPFRNHPNQLVCSEIDRCENGVYTDSKNVTLEDNVYELQNVGISNANKRPLLKEASEHAKNKKTIEVGAVRLAFTVIKDGQNLNDVFSNIIFDEKTKPDLIIKKLSHDAILIDGATSTFNQPHPLELFVVCNKVENGDKVVFSRSNEDGSEWEQEAETLDRCGSVLLIVRVPPYINPHHPGTYEKQEINVKLRLTRPHRPLEGRIWNTVNFQYIVDPVSTKRKRLLPLLTSTSGETSQQPHGWQSLRRSVQSLEPQPRPGPSRQQSVGGSCTTPLDQFNKLPYHQNPYTSYSDPYRPGCEEKDDSDE